MSILKYVLAAGAAVLLTHGVASATPQEVHSCYDLVKLEGVIRPALKRELFAVVDQTVKFNQEMQDLSNIKIQKFLRPGDRLVIMTFSAYAKDRYDRILLDAVLDENIPEAARYDLGKNDLAKFDRCRTAQEQAVRQLTAGSLAQAYAEADNKLPDTELINTMGIISREVMVPGKAEERYMLLISDMLEHSAITSFYAANKLKQINPDEEIKKVEKSNMIADFHGASVYVLGAGFGAADSYRSGPSLQALEKFWRTFFTKSQATVKGFGAPSLFGEIGQ